MNVQIYSLSLQPVLDLALKVIAVIVVVIAEGFLFVVTLLVTVLAKKNL